MSKKQIRNRLDKLFDEIKEEESATKEQAVKAKRSPRRGAPKRRPPIKRTGVLVLKAEPESTTIAEMQTDVQTDIAGSLSVMSLPLRVDEQSWATLQVIDDSAPREWNPEEQMLVQQVADQLSLALENARLFQETQEHAEELVVLNEMGRALASTLDVQEVAETVYRYVSRLTNTTNFYIALYDKAKDEIDFLLLYDRGRAIQGQTRKSGSGLAEYVLRTCEPLLMRENVAKQIKTLEIDLPGITPKSWLGVPMVIGEHVVGVIAIQDYEQVNAYDQHTVSLFESIASQAAIAIQNARLFEETQRRNEELALVNRVVGTAATSLDLPQSLQIIANEIAAAVSALHVGIALIDKDGTNLVLTADASASGSDQSDIGIVIPLANNPTAETVIAKGETLIINDVYHNPLAATIREIMKQRKTQSLYVLPLFSDKQVIGTVGIDFAEPDRQLDEKEMRLVKTVLLQASTTIERARLFQQMRESETRFRDVALSSADWVWEFDTQGRYSYCSDRVVDVLGYRPEEIIGKRLVEFMPEEDVSEFGRNIGKLVGERARLVDLEVRNLTKDGREVVLLANGVPVLDDDGKLLGYRGVYKDITEQKWNEKVQEAIRRISNAALMAEDMVGLIDSIHQAVGALMPAKNFYVALYDEISGLLSFPYHVDEHDEPLPPQKPDKGLTSYVLKTGKPLLATPEVYDQLEKDGAIKGSGTRGMDWLGVPLQSGDRIVGVMAVQTYAAEERLTAQDKDTLVFISNQVAVAIERKQSELELRALFAAMNDVILVVDKDTRYLRIAPTNPSRLYRPPEELLGQRMDEILPPETHELFRKAIHQALETGEIVNIEYPLTIEDQEIWFDASISRLTEDQVYWVARDVTERKKAEVEIRRLGNAVEQSLEGMAIADMDGYIQFVNRAWAEMHGYTIEELIGKHLSVFHTEEQLRDDVNTFNEVVFAEGANQGEVGHKRKDGTTFPTWMTVSILSDDNGAPIALVASAQDITERKRNEQILQRQNEYMAAAAEISRLVTSTLDLDVLFSRTVNLIRERFGYYHAAIFVIEETGFNAVVREATGEAGEEMKHRRHSLTVGSKSIVGTATSRGEPLIVNNTAVDPTHRPNPLLPDTRAEAAIPLRVGTRVIGALDLQATEVDAFTPEDIAVLQVLSDQIAVAIDNARSYELAQQAVREMRELDRLKSQFLANMSHELRTPLNSIIGFSRVILKGIDGPVTDLQQQDLTAIYNSGQHLLGLINDILDLSKIEAGKMELAFDEVNLGEMVKSVMSTVTGLVKDKPVKLQQNITSDIPTVRADPMRIRQVLINLLSNAAKFTDEGSISVEASIKTGPAGRPEVMVSITDTGPGISPEDQKKLFQPFSQVDSSPTRKTGGTGLGLSICQQLIKMHGGRIGVHSSTDKGSTFYFTLPIYRNKDDEAEKRDGQIILAIDDDAQVISLYERYLQPQGYQVVALTDPSRAKERVRQLKPYAVTLDIMMPGYDGWQVLADLKSDPETRDTPIIICSIVEEAEKGYSLGAADYLVKPIIEDDLLGALDRLNGDGSIREVLVIDDDPDDLRLLGKILSENGRYKPVLAEGGRAGWEVITSRTPHAVILDLFMPDMDGFTIIEKLRASPKFRDIPIVVVSGGDLTTEQREKLSTFGQRLFQKGSLNEDELIATLERTLKRIHTP